MPSRNRVRALWWAALSLALLLSAVGCSSHAPPPDITPLPAATRTMQPSHKEAAVLRTARSLIGAPYRWGGEHPRTGFDCSGFIWFVYHVNGVNIPRVTWHQFATGETIDYADLRPGDLMFYSVDKKGKSLHVGILTDRGTFIHAPSSGKSVMESSLNNIYWRERYIGARRVL